MTALTNRIAELTNSIADSRNRRTFVGGSDARIIMGDDEAALLRLWREKRGEVEPEDLSGNLLVQLGAVTEDLNRLWYQANTGEVVADVQRHVKHPALNWMAATLDGRVVSSGAVFEAKFMLPWSFSEEAAADSHFDEAAWWRKTGIDPTLTARLLWLESHPPMIRSIQDTANVI